MSSVLRRSALIAGMFAACVGASARASTRTPVTEQQHSVGDASSDVSGGDTASLRLFVAPRSAEVYVDGFYTGLVSDFDSASRILPMPAGQHELIFHVEGYRNLQRNVDFAPRSSITLRASLTELQPGEPGDLPPAPRPAKQAPASCLSSVREQAFGTLSIRTLPIEAQIIVDGRPVGADVDDLILSVPTGVHQVKVQQNGYEAVEKDVDVHADTTSELNVVLWPHGAN